MSRAKTLVTGATGMTGSHTVQLLLAKPAMLFSKSTAEQSHSNCKKELSLKRIGLLRRSAVGRQ